MKTIVSVQYMKDIEAYATSSMRMSNSILMEKAALGFVEEIKQHNISKEQKILVLCGKNNNGGDGMAIARMLSDDDYRIDYTIVGDKQEFSELADLQYKQLGFYSANEIMLDELDAELIDKYEIIIDAILGTGINRCTEGNINRIIEVVNSSRKYVLAVDIPSGLNGDNGEVMGNCIIANETITFGYIKKGLVLKQGLQHCGQIVVKDLGLNTAKRLFHLSNSNNNDNEFFSIEESDLINWLPKRSQTGNKGTFGKVLIIAGSKKICGASILCTLGAFKSGCGMVKLFTHQDNKDIIMNKIPEVMMDTYDDSDYDKNNLANDLKWCSIVAVGPGISTCQIARDILYDIISTSNKDLVIDADAINILAMDTELRTVLLNRTSGGEVRCVMTPHPKEFERLISAMGYDMKGDVQLICQDIFKRYGIIIVYKDYRSYICTEERYINLTGNDGMATAGSGDVLTGIIASLGAQSNDLKKAAITSTFIHGMAGDLAMKFLGRYAVMASDIVQMIPKVMPQ